MVYFIYHNLVIHRPLKERILQNIFVKVNELSEIVQDYKTLVSVFA